MANKVFDGNYLAEIPRSDSMTIAERIGSVPDILDNKFDKLRETQKMVDLATKRARRAQESAQYASGKSAGWFHKKAAIESLQDAVSDVADAQQAAADAQVVSFEYQKQLAEFSKFLLGLGVSSVAMNRTLIRELEKRLRGSSTEEIDDLVQREMLSVIKQLKQQEDIMNKQETLSRIVREHDGDLKLQNSELQRQAAKDAEHDRLFVEKTRKDKSQDEEIKRQAAKNAEHDRQLAEKTFKDKKQDEELKRQAAKDAEHDRLFVEKTRKDQSQDEELKRQAAKDAEHDRLLEETARKDQAQDDQLAVLQQQTEQQAQQILSMQQINTQQEQAITDLQERCSTLEKQLVSECEQRVAEDHNLATLIDLKAAKTANTVSIAIGAAALLAALIQFLI